MLKIFGVVALLGAVYAQNNSSLPTVDLGYEIYRASGFNSTGRFYNFSSIRYAAPPVGDLRFALPEAPAENRTTVQNGVSRICPQASPAWQSIASSFIASLIIGQLANNTSVNNTLANFTSAYVPTGANASSPIPMRSPLESEDCLFLDVFVPEDVLSKVGQGADVPVLVWIYGGGYTAGNKNNNPAGLLAASGNATDGNVIYVAMNYRLGALGFLAGPSFQAEGGVSNLALHDQRFALEWVQKYIHLFGGDKNRVTVFGESAGGGSIMHQITAYGGSKGKVPFQQAIPQSPGWLPIQSNNQTDDTYRKFLELTNTTSLAELRALPSADIIRANAQQVAYEPSYGSYLYGPAVDGDFVPLQPGQLLAQGRFDQDVQVMVGHNAYEGTLFTPPSIRTESDVSAQLLQAFPYMIPETLEYILQTLYPAVFNGSYPYTTQYERASLIISEGVFTCNTYYLSTASCNETYSYLFAIPPAFHGFDIPYTYYDGGAISPLGVANRTVAIALQQFITSFAENGQPEASGIPEFNMYGPDANVLKLNVTGVTEIRDPNANSRCAWWQKAEY